MSALTATFVGGVGGDDIHQQYIYQYIPKNHTLTVSLVGGVGGNHIPTI